MYVYDVRPNPILFRSVMVFSVVTGIVLLTSRYPIYFRQAFQNNSRQETLIEGNEGQTSVLCTATQSYFIQPSSFQSRPCSLQTTSLKSQLNPGSFCITQSSWTLPNNRSCRYFTAKLNKNTVPQEATQSCECKQNHCLQGSRTLEIPICQNGLSSTMHIQHQF